MSNKKAHCILLGALLFASAPLEPPLICTEVEYSCLKSLFARVLSIPASSAPVEKVFSHSGLKMKPNRGRMDGSLLEALVYLKCN